MRAHLAAPAILTLTLAARAQTPPDPEEVLARARDKILERTGRLPSYTCVQTVDRQYLTRTKPELTVPSCDQISAEKIKHAYALKVEATDRLRLDVKVSGGHEIGSWAGASHFADTDIAQFVKGPFGTGPFGAFLIDIFTTASVRYDFAGQELAAEPRTTVRPDQILWGRCRPASKWDCLMVLSPPRAESRGSERVA